MPAADTVVMNNKIDPRNHNKRRRDRSTAERVDLAALTARAFDLHAAKNYLKLSGVHNVLIESFAARFPGSLRTAEAERVEDRRRTGPAS